MDFFDISCVIPSHTAAAARSDYLAKRPAAPDLCGILDLALAA